MPGTSHQVDVLISAYNHGPFIERTIASVLGQTMGDLQLHIVDDGSTDDTWAIIERMGASDSRVHAVRQQNRGKVPTLNQLIGETHAPYVVLLDSDDVLRPERLAWGIADLEHNPKAQAATCWADILDADDKPLSLGEMNFYPKEHAVPLARQMLLTNRLCSATFFVRREALMRVAEPLGPYLIYQDYDLWLRLLSYGPLALRCEVGAAYRFHGNNLSETCDNRHQQHLAEKSAALASRFSAVVARHPFDCQPALGAIHGHLGLMAFGLGDAHRAARHLATRSKLDQLNEEEALVFAAALFNIGLKVEAQTYIGNLATQREHMTPAGQAQLDSVMLQCEFMAPPPAPEQTAAAGPAL